MATAVQKINPVNRPLSFLFDLFRRPNTSTKVSDHRADVAQAWSNLEQNYSRLHTALDELEAKEGDVIEFAHLAQALDLSTDLIQSHFDTICFTCIDERAQKNTHNELSVGVPGQFCLEKNQCNLFARKIVLDCKAAGLTKIKLMPHAKCGAATLAVHEEFRALGWDTANIPDILIDKKSIDYADRMATTIIEEAQRMEYELDVKVEFITVGEIEPRTFHNAVGSMVNVTTSDSLDLTRPHLDPKLFNENVDPMFNISGFGSDETIVDRIKLSIDIAFGVHGMSIDVFSAENPYLILMVADSKEAIHRAKNDILPLLKARVEEKYNDKIIESYILDISDLKVSA